MKSRKKFSALLTATTLLCAGCGTTFDQVEFKISDCENIRDEIVELSESDKDINGFAIVKIYEPRQISKNDTELICSGRAAWSDLDETPLTYKYYLDSEGEIMMEYIPGN